MRRKYLHSSFSGRQHQGGIDDELHNDCSRYNENYSREFISNLRF